jgi:hypothetical protein
MTAAPKARGQGQSATTTNDNVAPNAALRASLSIRLLVLVCTPTRIPTFLCVMACLADSKPRPDG